MSKTKFTLEDLFNLRNAVIYNPDDFKATPHVSIDTRTLRKGAIFFAIKGKNFDGHDFVFDAVKKGAGAVVVSKRKLSDFDDVEIPIVAVPNTVKAFGELARTKREKMNCKVIGITGSVGKTTTKEFVATLLSEKFSVAKTEANNNNHIGVPLTIMNAKWKDEIIVAELGTNHFGEIKYIAEIAQPDYALITNIGNSHTKFLKNRAGVLKEKKELFDVTENRGGKILLNIDDKNLAKLEKKYGNVVTFGFSEQAQIRGEIFGKNKQGFAKMRVSTGKRKIEFTLPVLGEANLNNALNAVAVAIELGLNNTQIKKGVKKFEAVNGRFEIIRKKSVTIIDDAYNASPESMRAAIESLAEIKAEKKIAILGDMLELGENSERQHKALSSVLRKASLDLVLLVGKEMRALATSKIKNVKYFGNLKSLIKFLDEYDFSKSVTLIKASRGMKLDKAVKILSEKYD